jgi:hypothetical protein
LELKRNNSKNKFVRFRTSTKLNEKKVAIFKGTAAKQITRPGHCDFRSNHRLSAQ